MGDQGDKITYLLSRLLLGTNHGNLNMELQLQSDNMKSDMGEFGTGKPSIIGGQCNLFRSWRE